MSGSGDGPTDAPVFPAASRRSAAAPRPSRRRHVYIHGGFTGTDAKFSFYMPEEEYQGRLFRATHQLLAREEATPRNIAFALASGGYSAQTNMGGSENPRKAKESAKSQSDTTIRGYRVNAAAAEFSRMIGATRKGDGQIKYIRWQSCQRFGSG